MKRVLLMGTPPYYNLGDIAIEYAERNFIKVHFPQCELICFSEENLAETVKSEKENINKEDLIFLHGGGNIGNQYISIEKNRRYIIENFPENKIVIFPQTIYFTEDEIGKEELKISKEIYSKHKNLTIIAREKESYEIMKKEFTENKVELFPDIVMYLNKYEERKRKGVLAIFRKDVEKMISEYEEKRIIKVLSNMYDNIEITDLAYSKRVSKEELNKKLFDIWDKYRQAELVVTDRLHGMIFAFITNTPCIALGNYNHKVESLYNTWFKDVETIQFVNNADEVNLAIERINKSNKLIDSKTFIKDFDRLLNIVKES